MAAYCSLIPIMIYLSISSISVRTETRSLSSNS
nr:MAG TPA: hypothetical protein [Caudoviricetes sp.]